MGVVHPVVRAWISGGGTGARNYDEFASDAEITEVIAGNPTSALAIEMPHLTPDNLGRDFSQCLSDAAARLGRQQASGIYTEKRDAVVLYRITGNQRGRASYGVFAMVDTDQISSALGEPGLVIRNEDVFVQKVRERVALAAATRHLLSPVLLLQTAAGPRLRAAIREAIRAAGEPAVSDLDHQGRVHEIWPLPAATEPAQAVLALAAAGELVVADGNHRSLAAQNGGLPRFLAVITDPASVRIDPYHRLITQLPVTLDEALNRLRGAGARVRKGPDTLPPALPQPGTVHLYTAGRTHCLFLPGAPATERPSPSTLVSRMDHAQVERLLLRDALGLDPGDKRIIYVGGDYLPAWLGAEVDSGRADLAVVIAPVTVDEFVAVNLARQKMPRKSTWFVPKARAGLVLADLSAEG